MHPFAEAGAKGAAPRSAEGKVSRRAETLRSGLQAIVAGDTGTRLTLLSRQGLTLSSEAGRRLYACCRPDVSFLGHARRSRAAFCRVRWWSWICGCISRSKPSAGCCAVPFGQHQSSRRCGQ